MSEAINPKYIINGTITKRDGTPVPTEEVIIFRATDIVLPELLDMYKHVILTRSGDKETHDAVTGLMRRVDDFQLKNRERVKFPDTKRGEVKED